MKRFLTFLVLFIAFFYCSEAQNYRMIVHLGGDSIYMPTSIVDSVTFDNDVSDNVRTKIVITDTITKYVIDSISGGGRISEVFDITNYALFTEILGNKKYSDSGELLDDEKYSSTTICDLDKNNEIGFVSRMRYEAVGWTSAA